MNKPNPEDDPLRGHEKPDHEFDNFNYELTITKTTIPMGTILREMPETRKKDFCGHEAMLVHYANEVDVIYDDNKAIEKFNTVTDELKTFAILLHFYSPGAYYDIRENYVTPLPCYRVLRSWYENDRFQPGFTTQAFQMLARRQAEKGSRLICALVADCLPLQNRYLEVVDVGAGPVDRCFGIVPREVFVILVQSLNEAWKIPIGFFIAYHVICETRIDLIMMSLLRTHEIGVDIVSVIQSQITLCGMIGCYLNDHKNYVTTFKHPACERQVATFIDPNRSLRSVRNHLERIKECYNRQKHGIRWEPISKLKSKPTKDIFLHGSVPLTDILRLRNMIAKIDFVSEVFNFSLAEVLILCKYKFKLQDFKDTEPLIEFINVFNTLHGVLCGKMGLKGPLCRENAGEIMDFLEYAKRYISSIYYFVKIPHKYILKTQLCVEDNTSTGFRGFLISIESLKYLYKSLVEQGQLDFLTTGWMCLDRMEVFFRNMRHRYPKKYAKFQPIYQSIFQDMKSDRSCQIHAPTQSYPRDSNQALEVIRKLTRKRSHDGVYTNVGERSRGNRTHLKIYKCSNGLYAEHDLIKRKQIVGYVAGWLAVQLAKDLRCEECIDALYVTERLWFHELITLQELRRVCLPSEMLFQVCWECERGIKSSGGAWSWAADDSVLRRMLSRASHIAHRHPHVIHRQQLVRVIVAKYIRLRLGNEDPRYLRETQRVRMTYDFDV